ncbi:MAG: helix-turn-helix transcriptional regulator [Chryseolinea sp.]
MLETNLFFNSPYQIISWDVLPDWKGWYILFGQDFIALNPAWKNFIVEFPFFRLDKSIPFNITGEDIKLADNLFESIYLEYHSAHSDKFQFIQSYTSLLLLLTKRYFREIPAGETFLNNNRTTDIILLSRFQTMVETKISDEDTDGGSRQPSFYAERLNVHPNYLNAVVKRLSGKTASSIIHNVVITAAKSWLRQTNLSVKEVAFKLHFTEATHFVAFFKKATGFTPQYYRKHPNV